MSDLLHQMLERNARKYPMELASVCHVTNTQLTWEEENSLANQLAYFLKEKGIKNKDQVAILFSNQMEFVVSFFAILKAGASVIPLNARLTNNEVRQITASMDAKAIIYHPVFSESVKDLEIDCFPFSITNTSFFESFSKENLDVAISTKDTAEVLLTSGTTGRPKGVLLSHEAVYQVAMMMSYEMEFKYQDKVLQIMPLSHSAPLNLTLMGSIFVGATSYLDNFDPQKILENIHNDRINLFFGAPIAYLLALKILQSKEYDLTSIKKWMYGGAPMPSNYLKVLREKFPGDFVGLYGLTEAGPNGIALYPNEHEHHIGAAGKRGVINSEFRLVDELGNDVDPNVEGEIILKTKSMMTGYYKNPEATEEAIKDGWLYTGDIGKLDEEGYLYIIDRKKDVIITGGVNVYPSEVEDLIIQRPDVQDVAVISKPHEEWGETVIAVIVKASGAQVTEEEIKKDLANNLAKYKIPREIVFVDDLPRNASGKILKHRLREMYRQI